MARPIPTVVLHFTHFRNLAAIVADGLRSDTHVTRFCQLQVEAGQPEIKERRRHRVVGAGPGGHVSDYVPFYFAPRSPMMYKLAQGGVSSFADSAEELVYIESTVEILISHGLRLVVTDRNAAVRYAEFSELSSDWDALVDWSLMRARVWKDTEEFPDRKERRMAECLVHEFVPWSAVSRVCVHNVAMQANVRSVLASLGVRTEVAVEPEWYFERRVVN